MEKVSEVIEQATEKIDDTVAQAEQAAKEIVPEPLNYIYTFGKRRVFAV